jgi:hypothetical protein
MKPIGETLVRDQHHFLVLLLYFFLDTKLVFYYSFCTLVSFVFLWQKLLGVVQVVMQYLVNLAELKVGKCLVSTWIRTKMKGNRLGHPSGQRVGLGWAVDSDGHFGFDSTLGVPLNYWIHGFDGWNHVSGVYSLRVGPKGPAFVRFHVLKK